MEIENEVWVTPILDGVTFHDYKVSNMGRIKSFKFGKERLLKGTKTRKGYILIDLREGGEAHTYSLHRIVASMFIPNPDNLPMVNHIDEDKLNNTATNLEWCTVEYNNNYGTRLSRAMEKITNNPKTSIPIVQLDPNTRELIATYPSCHEAGRQGFCYKHINSCCRHKRRTCGGYIWMYKSEYEGDISNGRS